VRHPARRSPGVLENLVLSRATVDRASHRRPEPGLLERLWADERTLVLPIGEGRVPVVERGGRPHLASVPPSEVTGDGLRIFLGTDAEGRDHVAATTVPGEGWRNLRQLGAVLDATDAGLMTLAVALTGWHLIHTHCPRCGAPTTPAQAGWTRLCGVDGSEHYPRTDPAVIMAVTDDDDRLLLGRGPRWPHGRFSTLAGFVEPGETLEAAVRREVAEETGVLVGDVAYLGNQPWPFPASLMLGFTGRALDPTIQVDGVEIAEARWFSRAELAEESAAGRVLLPSGISIARHLVEHWYGAQLDGAGTWR
jgi:NAD+ diphosphatase